MSAAEADSARERKTLRLLIEQTAGAVLVFCLYTRRAIRRDVNAWLRTNSSVPVQEFTLSQQTADPSTVLASFSPTPRQCIVFDEVESAFPKFLGYVNFQREQLLGSGHALLFWIREEGLRRIAEEAPDFWAWRSRVFDFRTVPDSFHLPQSAPADPAIASYSAPDLTSQVAFLESSATPDLTSELALGRRYLALARFEEATRSLQSAARIAQQQGDRRALAEALYLLGNAAFQQDQLIRAEKYYLDSLGAVPSGEGTDLHLAAATRIGEIHLKQGNLQAAQTSAQQAVSLAQVLNSPLLSAQAFDLMGSVLLAMRNPRRAAEFYRRALEYAEKAGSPVALALTLVSLGYVYAELGDLQLAQQTFRRAGEISDQNGFHDLAARVRDSLAKLIAS